MLDENPHVAPKSDGLGVPRFGHLAPFGVAVAMLLNLGVLASGYQFVSVTPGAYIRPMGWAGLVFMLGAVGLTVSLPASLVGWLVAKRRRLGLIGVILSMTPVPLGVILLHSFAAWIGFHLAE